MRKFTANLMRSLLPVNPFAGKLRLLLLILLLFIFWTVIAQNITGNLDTTGWLSGGSGFIADILGELAGRYFHPGTLGLTLTPFLLFFLARDQVAAFFSRDGFLEKRSILQFLNHCVFSLKNHTVTPPGPASGSRLEIFGGPANMQISPGDLVIIEDLQARSFTLHSSVGTKASLPFDPGYGKRVASALQEEDLEIQFIPPGSSAAIRIQISFHKSSDPHESPHVESCPLSANDAAFLVFAQDQKKAVQLFIDAEAARYYRMNKEAEYPLEEDAGTQIRPKIKVPLRSHNNYAHIASHEKSDSRGFSRPHKRTQFSLPYSVIKEDGEAGMEAHDAEIPALIDHIQREVESFFSLTHIQLSNE